MQKLSTELKTIFLHPQDANKFKELGFYQGYKSPQAVHILLQVTLVCTVFSIHHWNIYKYKYFALVVFMDILLVICKRILKNKLGKYI